MDRKVSTFEWQRYGKDIVFFKTSLVSIILMHRRNWVIAIVQATNTNPTTAASAATMAASVAFMLPVATPPNALV